MGIPLSFKMQIYEVAVLLGLARKMQLILARRLRDHAPLMVVFELPYAAASSVNKRTLWDHDKMMAALTKGEGRPEFVGKG